MFMRFRVQYRDRERALAARSSQGADSRWQRVGAGRRGEHDAGWTFEFKPPEAGGRARAARRRDVRVAPRQAASCSATARITEAGHPGTAGAEPADFSAATCEIA